MPRGNKAGPRGKPRYPPRGAQFEPSFTPFSGSGTSSPRGGPGGLTLQEEAWNTERHHSFWANDQRLRHSKISFISAGSLAPTKPPPEDPESALAQMTLDSPPHEKTKMEVEIGGDGEAEEWRAHDLDNQPAKPLPPSSPLFFIDTVGDETPSTGLPAPQTRLRSLSPTPSNSSDEVILFQGRNNRKEGMARSVKAPLVLTDPVDAKTASNRAYEREVPDATTSSEAVSSKFPRESTGSSPGEFDAILSKPRTRRGRRGRSDMDQEEEDALIADYIANIEGEEETQGWDTHSPFFQRPLGGSGDDAGQEDTESPAEQPVQTKSQLHSGWDRSNICDFDELSTSDGVMGEVEAILSKRNRTGGVQYLVVWEGQSVDEARWVPATTLTSAESSLRINVFEEEEKLVAEYKGNDDEDSSDSEDTDIDDALDEEDDEDLWQSKADHLTDEQIARLLAKQEELGMGSNELLLLDDAADADEDDDIPPPAAHHNPFMLSSHSSRIKSRGAKRPRGEFPVASALADAYEGFDVMDFDRPSLKKKPKGRRGKLPFDLSDSDLEVSLQAAYENDRAKKKERKQQREALRAEGLLGSKNGKPNLKDKYREGMGIGAVKDEIKAFLLSNNTTLGLPPMDKADRKVVHELANAFNLKSKSAGTGNKRFPVLYRTSRTLAYSESTFDSVEARISRRFLPRMDVSGKRAGGASKGGRGGFGNAAVSYKDGDVVGASAPELGVENRGRAMLEKMGWSTGTALGALNNKGILQPVSHVVKTTKAGLG